ncbi:MAG: cysteine hydrolase [Actinobacteria bacterium]|nr:cysteine hydrolase [Actinomycetota bacterium]
MAAPSLQELIDPARTAVVTSEVQNGVVGPSAALPELAALAAPMVERAAVLCSAARAGGIRVVHATAARRADAAGSNDNARLFAAVRRSPVTLEPGSPAVQVVAELGPEPEDIVLCRLHGLSPMAGTDLDPILRNLGVRTVIVAGVSVNVAITNLVMDAVNLGYQVVLPRDAVTGVPTDYAEAVIDNTLAVLATITTVDEIVAAWAGATAPRT